MEMLNNVENINNIGYFHTWGLTSWFQTKTDDLTSLKETGDVQIKFIGIYFAKFLEIYFATF